MLTEQQRSTNKSFYNENAELYARERAWIPENEELIRDKLVKEAWPHIDDGDVVLVLGVGTGKDKYVIERMNNEKKIQVVGLDLSIQMMRESSCRGGRDLIQADLTKKLPFKDKSFDFIYCEAAGEHLDKNDLKHLFRECRRILRTSEKQANMLMDVRNGKGSVVEVMDFLNGHGKYKKKFFTTFELGQYKDMLDQMGISVFKQWQGWGGTPRIVYSLPWLNTLLKL